MTNEIKPSFNIGEIANKTEVTPSVNSDIPSGGYLPGAITHQIGTGEHAKDSFIWTTLKYCFYLGATFSICLMLAYFHFVFDKDDAETIDIVAALKDIWSIFTPILTLALGYAFGKRDRIG